ncbi:MAG TPA: type II and III secretion system protein, partial [Bdellovibrionota bacterium]|nr:type II and III secretion system protein [Bdellovibrionota bacterium]
GEVSSQDDKDKLLANLNNQYPFIVDLIKIGPGSQKLIQIDVRLLEISRSQQKQIGLTYPETIKVFSLQDLIQRLAHRASSTPSLDVFLQLLSEKGFAKILSHPKLVCQNGKEASFMAGGEIPIRIISRITSQISWRSYGMILKITPTASPQQHIHTQLSVELSSLDPAHTTDGIPGILSRKLETAVTVKEKQTIVLSGLLSKNLSESQNKVPFLGDIPVLGNLFQVNRKREDQTELMIIVTPQLMETN